MARNILLTSAGRRVSLLNLIKAAVRELDPSIQVIAADSDPEWSAAVQTQSEHVYLPKVDDSNFRAGLAKIVEAYEIGLIIPLIDPELELYAELREDVLFSNTRFLLSSDTFIQSSSDKKVAMELFLQLGFLVPKEYTSWPGFPVFARPLKGSGSIHAQRVDSEEQFNWLAKDARHFVFTEYLDPKQHESYTIDAYYDQGRLISCVPRQRVEVRSGEISKGRTVKGELYRNVCSKINYLSGAHGPIGIQVFRNVESEAMYGIEFNARFCGGYPLTEACGAPFTHFLIEAEILGRELRFQENWKEEVKMLRYDEAVFL